MASGLNGERTINISTITAIQVKSGGWLPGYILFSYAGSKPFGGGILQATQDPDAFVFQKELNNEIKVFKEAVELAIASLQTPRETLKNPVVDAGIG
jgi:hypothetical protein